MMLYTFSFLAVTTALQLPAEFKKCSRSDPKINECLKSAIERAYQVMGTGIKEFKLESTQPITVANMTIGEGTGVVRVVQNYQNWQLFNIPSAEVVDLSSLVTDHQFNINVTYILKETYVTSHYKLNGRILLLPIVGEGECTIQLHNLKVPTRQIGEVSERNGVKYVEITSLKVQLIPDKVEFDFKNLFNGDPKLGPEMNKILNENWKEIFEDVKYAYEDALGAVFKNVGNLIFRKVPYDDLFLP
ncbi:hypothetical protein PPYR_14552 [Photinus pyralis]|uniref:Protein takeout n=1 Tax=Photinus pyralis TaxID=7054 RepID=A0A1Y1KWX3_PHOPY|nr:protein takeout-like [Photinus pyralis]KAB0792593.1 hypothetical protein PPYR_14552 [Photinus pyralis]